MQREFSPMNAAEVMDKVVDVYKRSFWKQMAWAAVFYVGVLGGGFFALIVGIFVTAFLIGLLAAFDLGGGANALAIVGISAVILIIPLFLFWQTATGTGHILLAKPELYGFKVKIFDREFFKVVLRVFTALLAQILFTIPFFIVATGAVLAFIASVGNFFITESLSAFFGFLTLLAVLGLGSLMYSHVFSLAVPAAIFEELYFFGAIKRSWELIKTDFFRTLGIRTIWVVVAVIVSTSVQGAFSLVNSAFSLLAGTVPMLFILSFFVTMFTGLAGPAISSIITAPLDGLMQAVIYFNQRIKNEGFDVELQLNKLLHEREATQ
ncbi:MAG: hypothetical protein FWC70_05030 [Defluviitaleaceae bacterium]|nr:hypothetical protein [Defluviitaleaceae bacterium]